MKCLTRRTAAARVTRLRASRIAFLIIAGASVSSCKLFEDKSACGKETLSALNLLSGKEALASPERETSLVAGRRTFSWSFLVENVCSDEHAKGTWSLTVATNELPSTWTVEAGYLITALSGSNVPLTAQDVAANIREYRVTSDIGLSQAFDEAPGRFLMFLEISFTSGGSISLDVEIAERAIRQLALIAGYKEPKTN